ncbi:hypothetical protein [Fundidesulfovibrio agrisoli]|uniref:hypothetical protein n=1 Tax=Fundidesulfovibrio agrisoli TaxID=2922717 RepID=UPI001FAE6C06|nr:hypothetical protein [Fundidesulfovibrio agrisoli]
MRLTRSRPPLRPLLLALAVIAALSFGALSPRAVAAQSALPPDTAAFLESLVGKYPDSRILNDPRLKPLLVATLGPRRFAQLVRGWGNRINDVVVSPIEKQQDAIVITACKPHDCLAFNATIYVNLKDGSVQACWRAEAGEPAFDQWLTPQGAKALEDGECTATRRERRDI